MSCLPSSSKCEWQDLQYFVAMRNAQQHTAFERTSCLDLCSSTRQPEVLCTDKYSGRKLVIERKNLLWPLNAAEIHSAEHRFWSFLLNEIHALKLPDELYVLSLDTTQEIRDLKLKALAKCLASIIDTNRHALSVGNVIKGAQPLRFSFCIGSYTEREDGGPSSGVYIRSNEPEIRDLNVPESVPSTFVEQMQQYVAAAVEKFSEYDGSTKVLILNFTAANLYLHLNEMWWSKYFAKYPLPSGIDEVWSSLQYASSQWSHSLLHSQPLKSSRL